MVSGVIPVADIELRVHDVIIYNEGIIFVETDGSRIKLIMNEREKELLGERLQEQIQGGRRTNGNFICNNDKV